MKFVIAKKPPNLRRFYIFPSGRYDKIKDRDVFLWYAERNGETGWTVDALKEQIENGLYEAAVGGYYGRLTPPSKPVSV